MIRFVKYGFFGAIILAFAAILTLPVAHAKAADDGTCGLVLAEQNVNLIMVKYHGSQPAQVHWPFDNGGATWSDGESKAIALAYEGGPHQTVTANMVDTTCTPLDITINEWLPPDTGTETPTPQGVAIPRVPVTPGSMAWHFIDMTVKIDGNHVCISGHTMGQLPLYPARVVFGGFDNASAFPVRAEDGSLVETCHDYEQTDLDAGVVVSYIPDPLGDLGVPALIAHIDSTMTLAFASNDGRGSYQVFKES